MNNARQNVSVVKEDMIRSVRPGSISLRDMAPGFFNSQYNTPKRQKIHDANFAFVTSTLSKIHEKVYEPKVNTTYAVDIPVKVGGGMVDYVDFFSVDWAGRSTPAQNLFPNNANVVPRVNASLEHKKVNVYTYEIAYDIKFIEIDKLNKVNFTKSIEAIYKDIILADFELFVDQIAYEGNAATQTGGLFDSPNVPVMAVPQGTQDPTKAGLAAMKDEEIVSFFNGIFAYYLNETNNNMQMLPDTILLPMNDSAEMSSRYSELYTDTLRNFLREHNVAADEANAAGVEFKVNIRGRARLNGKGTNSAGRAVVYRKDEDFVRIDLPYPIQAYYTGPNTDKFCYTTLFVGQISDVQMPYNDSAEDFGAVSYWDFAAATRQ